MTVARSATGWPVVEVDAIDTTRAAQQLIDELGHERCGEIATALVVSGCGDSNELFDAVHGRGDCYALDLLVEDEARERADDIRDRAMRNGAIEINAGSMKTAATDLVDQLDVSEDIPQLIAALAEYVPETHDEAET
jgi:hypothetical protein